jgi:phosphatidate cytidylyltransferase
LYTIGFVGFVMSLQKGYLKQQFGLFGWVHMSLLIIVLSRRVAVLLFCVHYLIFDFQSFHHK